ncbi:hypothetical protein V495_08264 [Pseudogymnoascus sp. VKM F-4514 (FW-929)]|nr:hypothetical protein V495_08264 [Pseudogymnoascus sp. VKM F-4514 (FW-929)]KFY61634.1 hypothetical protein V497_02825 [Pseudogymnoascus sp. VKM F-4516 (FW-969)]
MEPDEPWSGFAQMFWAKRQIWGSSPSIAAVLPLDQERRSNTIQTRTAPNAIRPDGTRTNIRPIWRKSVVIFDSLRQTAGSGVTKPPSSTTLLPSDREIDPTQNQTSFNLSQTEKSEFGRTLDRFAQNRA